MSGRHKYGGKDCLGTGMKEDIYNTVSTRDSMIGKIKSIQF